LDTGAPAAMLLQMASPESIIEQHNALLTKALKIAGRNVPAPGYARLELRGDICRLSWPVVQFNPAKVWLETESAEFPISALYDKANR
jgi:hypothetical protein